MIRVPAAICIAQGSTTALATDNTDHRSALPVWTVVAVFVIGGMLAGIILYGSAAQLWCEVDPDAAVIQTTMVAAGVIDRYGYTD